MGSFYSAFSPFILDNHISVKAASLYTGYSSQYLRRLLRQTRLRGIKLGQIWFVDKAALDSYLKKATQTIDNRFGPQSERIFQQTNNNKIHRFEIV
jgi:excisionase family DNA binding protein